MMDQPKIKLVVKHPQFNLLPNGTKVVFVERQCYCNIRYHFGIVVKNRRGRNQFQAVNEIEQKTVQDPITTESVVQPQWDNLRPEPPYNVGISHGSQYLKGYTDTPPNTMMSFIPTFEGIYDPATTYTNCYDYP